MNTDFQTANKGGKCATVEWYTPPEIIMKCGVFDLDPATSIRAYNINHSAKKIFTLGDNGLMQRWEGRVWLNPPYKNPVLGQFMQRMANHNNGVALVYNRCDSTWFQDYVLGVAHSILYLKKRIHFIKPDGTVGDRPGAGSVLIAYGEDNTKALESSGLLGKLILIKNIPIK